MSRIGSVESTPDSQAGVQAAIGRAAQATGTDFDYLLAQARLESGLDPAARARTSSAAGLFQFVDATWLATLDRHGAAHGLGWAAEAIDGGRMDRRIDPAMRAGIMALRYDPDAAATMAGELAADNRAALTAATGREPGATELYLAHFLGAEGATRFLRAEQADPSASAAALLPRAAAANRSIFYHPAGGARSLGEVHGLISAKMDAALAQGGAVPDPAPWAAPAQWAAPASVPASTGPVAREFAARAASLPQIQGGSMADTLRASFGTAAPAHVRAAYGQLRSLGL